MDGKPTPSAALMSALVRRAGHRVRIKHEPDRKHGVCGMVWCEIVRSDDPFVFRTEWTVERAVEAELCQIRDGKPYHRTMKGKTGNWQKFPVAMMKARALAECARDACEEALMGMHYTAEELGADVDVDGDPIVVTLARDDEQAPEDLGPEPDWDAVIAEVERSGNITPAWKLARRHRPDDEALRIRIQTAGQTRRAKPADEVVDAEIVEDTPAAPNVPDKPEPATEPPPKSVEAREALEEFDAICAAMELDVSMAEKEFAKRNKGSNIRNATTPAHAALIRKFIETIDTIDPTLLKKPAAVAS
jgi:hypothetical protein